MTTVPVFTVHVRCRWHKYADEWVHVEAATAADAMKKLAEDFRSEGHYTEEFDIIQVLQGEMTHEETTREQME